MSRAAIDTEPSRCELLAELERNFSEEAIRRRRRMHVWHSTFRVIAMRAESALERLGSASMAFVTFVLLSPLLVVLFAWLKARKGRLGSRLVLGRNAVPFSCFRFEFPDPASAPAWAKTPLVHLPALINAVRGEMSLIGPRPVTADELPASDRSAWRRYDIRPGFISPWWLRQKANIDYTKETDLDAEYVETRTFLGDVGIALRAVPALAFGGRAGKSADRTTILGIPIANVTMAQAIEEIIALAESGRSNQVCFVNAGCANLAFSKQSYKHILNTCSLVLADGIGMRLAGKVLKQPIRQNVNGTDLLPPLCAAAAKKQLGLYLLGGRSGVPEAAAAWIRKRHPSIRICGIRSGYFSGEQEPEITSEIRDSGAAILLVGLGVPRQEEWIAANRSALGTIVAIGVGGLFDFYSGRIPRAPVWMREIGMEWCFRFMQEPRRMWRRYLLGNAVFLYRVLKERRLKQA